MILYFFYFTNVTITNDNVTKNDTIAKSIRLRGLPKIQMHVSFFLFLAAVSSSSSDNVTQSVCPSVHLCARLSVALL